MIKKCVLGICKLSDTFVIVLLFAPLIFFFGWLNLYSLYILVLKFLVTSSSTEMTNGYTDTLLSFQIFLTLGFGTHCIGGSVGTRAGLEGCGKSHPQ